MSWATNRLHVFVAGSDKQLYGKAWLGAAWAPSQTTYYYLGGPIAGDPEVVTWGPDRLDLFVRKDDGRLYVKSWPGDHWEPSETEFTPLGAPAGTTLSGQPSIVTWGRDRLDIFVAASDGNVYTKSWLTDHWVPSQLDYESLGAPAVGVAGPPKAVTWGPENINIVLRGKDGAIYAKTLKSGAWVPSRLEWTALSSPPSTTVRTDPVAVSWGPNRFDFYVIGNDDNAYAKAWDTDHWIPSEKEWYPLGGPVGN
jgi:hypothetical protein